MSSTTEYKRYHVAVPDGYDCEKPFSVQSPPNGWTASTFSQPLREFSLVFVVDIEKRRVLLGRKRRGVGVGLYNGFGGKPEKDETILQCAKRELTEESLLVPVDSGFYRVGHLDLSRPKHGGREVFRIVIFGCTSWTGEPGETDEMSPEWFDVPSSGLSLGESEEDLADGSRKAYPLSNMWPEARLFHIPILHLIMGAAVGRHDASDVSSDISTTANLTHPGFLRDTNANRELVAKLEYDHVDPTTVQPWTLIRRHHSNDPILEDDVQEALTGWYVVWGTRDQH